MTARLIEHVAIIVPDLDDAIRRWSDATGYTFSPVSRYRSHEWRDASDHEAHLHDARMVFSLEGPPRIELIEATGQGIYSPAVLGINHFAFPGVDDLEAERARLEGLGFPTEATSHSTDGELLLFFTAKSALDGIHLEYISPSPKHPSFPDDGS